MVMYGIMRIEKRRRSAVFGLQLEANRTLADHKRGREFLESDIDWEKTSENEYLIHTEHWNKAITQMIKENELKEKKDSVVMLDGIYTASPEFFNDKPQWMIRSYFEQCLEFHVREYCQGDKSKVINAVIHRDEKTCHLHVASCPIFNDEKGAHLSAKVIMGNRGDYRKHQDSFFEQVSNQFGLERGEIKDSLERKTHTLKREWQLEQIKEQTIKLVKYHNKLVDVSEALRNGNYELAKMVCREYEMSKEANERER